MNIRHKQTKNIKEYHFEISSDQLFPKCPDNLGEVVIVFENEKFKRCDFPFRGNYTREAWAMLAEIETEITRIEMGF